MSTDNKVSLGNNWFMEVRTWKNKTRFHIRYFKTVYENNMELRRPTKFGICLDFQQLTVLASNISSFLTEMEQQQAAVSIDQPYQPPMCTSTLPTPVWNVSEYASYFTNDVQDKAANNVFTNLQLDGPVYDNTQGVGSTKKRKTVKKQGL